MIKNWVIVSLIFIVLCSCSTFSVVSLNPISGPIEIDKRLLGIWKYESQIDEQVYLHIGKISENRMVALYVEHKINGKLDIGELPFFISKTDTNNFVNIKYSDFAKRKSEEKKGFIFFKYLVVENEILQLFQLSQKSIISAIKANKLKGQVTYRESIHKKEEPNAPNYFIVKDIIITDTSENIIDFFEADNNQNIFLDLDLWKFIKVK